MHCKYHRIEASWLLLLQYNTTPVYYIYLTSPTTIHSARNRQYALFGETSRQYYSFYLSEIAQDRETDREKEESGIQRCDYAYNVATVWVTTCNATYSHIRFIKMQWLFCVRASERACANALYVFAELWCVCQMESRYHYLSPKSI